MEGGGVGGMLYSSPKLMLPFDKMITSGSLIFV